MASVTGIVLAAGASERMGEQKLLLPYRGTTILNVTIATVVSSRVDRVIVVTGAGADAIEESIEDQPVAIVRNPRFDRGNMSSLLTATDADLDAGAFVLVPGDLPAIGRDAIDATVDLWTSKAPWAAVTEYVDRVAHPFLLSRAAVDEAAADTGIKVLWRSLVASEDPRVVRLPSAAPAPTDVNTPADYDELRGSA